MRFRTRELAKFAYGLITRIYAHLLEQGWLKEGDVVADPFAGVGVGGVVAAANGLRWIGVELEQPFCDLAGGCDCTGVNRDDWVRYWARGRQSRVRYKDGRHICPACIAGLKYQGDGRIPFSLPHRYKGNFELHRDAWERMQKPFPIILHGDSRNFSSIIRGAVDSVITSPPFQESLTTRSDESTPTARGLKSDGTQRGGSCTTGDYGQSEGQIGTMKEGNLEQAVSGIVTSPPFYPSGQEVSETDTTASIRGRNYARNVYGEMSEGQIGGMEEGEHKEVVSGIVTSPPYVSGGHHPDQTGAWGGQGQSIPRELAGYGSEGGQIGRVPEGSHEEVVDGVITSPPWEKSMSNGLKDDDRERYQEYKRAGRSCGQDYGSAKGQIGREESETYWSSVAQVYSECLKVLRPGGVMAIVVKSFVRDGQIIDLPSQTLELLEAIGFEPLERIRAWMTSPVTQKSLIPEMVDDYTKKHLSFFRRLHMKKNPHLAIEFEVVLVVRKPAS